VARGAVMYCEANLCYFTLFMTGDGSQEYLEALAYCRVAGQAMALYIYMYVSLINIPRIEPTTSLSRFAVFIEPCLCFSWTSYRCK
jgi:hypothetical protein